MLPIINPATTATVPLRTNINCKLIPRHSYANDSHAKIMPYPEPKLHNNKNISRKLHIDMFCVYVVEMMVGGWKK